MTAKILPFTRPINEAVMALHSSIPKTAITAQLLGTERNSHAVQITPEGLMITVGYSIMEASEIWITNNRGQSTEAIVLAHDYDSGLALLRPSVSLGTMFLESAPASSVKIGDELSIIISQSKKAMSAQLLAKEVYAGRWEYLLEEAFYTVPICDNWSGAALLNASGQLCGIGCLALGLTNPEGDTLPGNLFIPTDLITPHIEHMNLYGKKPGDLRPWLGTLIDENDSELHVVGLYQGGPAAEAGILLGDIIISVGQQPVTSMANFFRTIWHYGPAGSVIPITLSDGTNTRDVILKTIDRNSFFVQYTSDTLN